MAVILAAGLGSRLGAASASGPKGLLRFGQTTLVERSIQLLRNAGISRVALVTGYMAERYRSLCRGSVTAVSNVDFERTGSLESLLCAESLIREDFLVLESDIVYEKRALEAVLTEKSANVFLAAGLSGMDDAVYVSADSDLVLNGLSKSRTEIRQPFGEMVGITKLEASAVSSLTQWTQSNGGRPSKKHYEDGLVGISPRHALKVKRVADLIWQEVDTEDHLKHLREVTEPTLTASEGK